MDFLEYLIPSNPMALKALDILLHVVHISLVLFVLFGAFFSRTIKIHFPVLMVIWVSWIGIGAYVGTLGYCVLTDWHWRVKFMQGEILLPPSYIEYLYNFATGKDVDNGTITIVTALVMISITLISAFKYIRRI